MRTNNGFMETKSNMDDIFEQKEKIILKASQEISAFLKKENNAGVSDAKAVQKNLEKLLEGWGDEDKVAILIRVAAYLTINL